MLLLNLVIPDRFNAVLNRVQLGFVPVSLENPRLFSKAVPLCMRSEDFLFKFPDAIKERGGLFIERRR